jgi:uncharacterized protein (TIGR02270 family)
LTSDTHIAPQESSADVVLWDILEEHFDEAEFLFGQWEQALHSPRYTLGELASTVERRLEAHVDGLVVGGPDVAARLLDPNLANADEPAKATIAVLALLSECDTKTAARVLDVLQSSQGPLQEAIARGLVLTNSPLVDRLMLERFRASDLQPQNAILMETLTRRGVDTRERLPRCLRSSDQALVSSALDAVGRFGHREMLPEVESFFRAGESELRHRAVKTGLALSSRAAWDLCRQLAAGVPRVPDPEFTVFVAALGRPVDHQILYRQLENPQSLEQALWCLGFCGTLEAGDACVPYLQSKDERVAKMAASSIAWLAGLDLNNTELRGVPREPAEDETLPAIEEDALDADLVLDGIDDLPVPHGEAIAQRWRENQGRLGQARRSIFGLPFSPGAIIAALDAGPLWRRHAVALELSVRTGGREHVSTTAFSSCQRRQMAALTGMDLGFWAGD